MQQLYFVSMISKYFDPIPSSRGVYMYNEAITLNELNNILAENKDARICTVNPVFTGELAAKSAFIVVEYPENNIK